MKRKLIEEVQSAFNLSAENFSEIVLDIWFVPEFRGDRGGFVGNAHFVGSKIRARLEKGYTEFYLSEYGLRHNAAAGKGKSVTPSVEFLKLLKEADCCFNKYSPFSNYCQVERFDIIDYKPLK